MMMMIRWCVYDAAAADAGEGDEDDEDVEAACAIHGHDVNRRCNITIIA